MSITKAIKKSPKNILGGFLLLLVFLSMLNVNFFTQDRWIYSDNASEVLLAKEMLFTRSILPSSWYSSTGIETIHTQLIIAPILAITNNMLFSRSAANMIVVFLLCFSLFLYLRSLDVPKHISLILIALALSPLSSEMLQYMSMGTFYTPFIVIILFFLQYMHKIHSSKKTGIIRLALFILAAFLVGLSGTRFILMLFLPIAMTELFLIYIPTETVSLKYLTRITHSQPILVAISFLFACILGFLVNKLMLANGSIHYLDPGTVTMTDILTLPSRMGDAVIALLYYVSDLRKTPLLSNYGITCLFKLVFFFYSLFLAIRRTAKWTQLPFLQKYYVAFFWISTLLNLFLILFSTIDIASRYFSVNVFLLIPFFAIELKECQEKTVKLWIMVALVFVVILSGQYTIHKLNQLHNPPVSQRKVIEYLDRNSLTFGYATFLNADLISFLSNGNIELASIDFNLKKQPLLWLTPNRYYDAEYHRGKTFLLLTEDEERKAQPDLLEGSTKMQTIDDYVIFEWDKNPFNFLSVYDFTIRELSLKDLPRKGGSIGSDGAIILKPNEYLYGPYSEYHKGKYRASFRINGTFGTKALIRVTSNAEKSIISELVTDKSASLSFNIDKLTKDVEFPVFNVGKTDLRVESITIEKER